MLSLVPWVFLLILPCFGENSASIIMKDQDLAQSFQPHCLAAVSRICWIHNAPFSSLPGSCAGILQQARGSSECDGRSISAWDIQELFFSLHRHREVLYGTKRVKRANMMKSMVQYMAFLLARSKLSPAAWNSRGCFSPGSLKSLTH